MELLSAPLLATNDILNVRNIVLCFNQRREHVGEDVPLSDSGSRPSLPIKRIMGTEPLLQRWIDMVLENAGQVDRIFFEVIEGADGIALRKVV